MPTDKTVASQASKLRVPLEALLEVRAREFCEICGKPRGDETFHVDHKHQTGPVGRLMGILRGLLCPPCNTNILPAVEHAPHLIWAAFAYLNKYEVPPGASCSVRECSRKQHWTTGLCEMHYRRKMRERRRHTILPATEWFLAP